MEQNGTTTDKRNWRERLGIGTRDMPKLSDEFKSSATDAAPAAAPRPAVKAPLPVAKPAPMAPRNPAPRPAAAPPSNGRQAPAAPSGSSGSDALAEKLRAQRAAAEKLAEQRVAAARERAESRGAEPPAPPPARPRPIETTAPPAASGAAKPKFSFADDGEAAPRPANGPLVPPRPALGGERSQPPFLRQATQPAYRPETPPHRPSEPGGFTPSRPAAPYRPSYGGEPGAYAPAKRPAYDAYARQGEPTLDRGYPGDQPRLGRPAPARGRARGYEDDQEDVFEDDPQPRRRASARDYQSAYAEHDEPFEEDRRRSSGPWLLFLALAVIVALGVGGWWTYGKYWKLPAAGTQTATDQVPVVAAPEEPAKTAPEVPADAGTATPAAQRKQIYDRIVGEQEMTGDQVVPTEEVPVQPEPAQAVAPAEPVGLQGTNDAGAAAIPEPTAAVPDSTQETEPLPLPPPPDSDQQGSLAPAAGETLAAVPGDPPAMPPPDPGVAATEQATAAANTATEAAAAPAESAASTAQAAASDAAAAPTAESAALTEQAAPPSTEQPAVKAEETVIETPPPPKAATKTKTAAKKKATTEAAEDLGAEPVVLVPPSENPIQGGEATTASQSAATTTQPAKKKTIFDLFKSGGNEQQVAAVEPEPAPAPSKPATKTAAKQPETTTTSSSGSGYTIQLASFRTQGEAQEEYNRLRSSYPDIIGGLPSKISQATVAGSTRYRVGVGPVGSKEQANSVCSKLFAAGERDCLIRGP